MGNIHSKLAELEPDYVFMEEDYKESSGSVTPRPNDEGKEKADIVLSEPWDHVEDDAESSGSATPRPNNKGKGKDKAGSS